MALKEQNKILDAKIESNINQYKVNRLNAEISAFSSGDLNKYNFLTRKDLKYKLNAFDKARFKIPPLGKAFSARLDKTVPNYQKEGVIKLLKNIRDNLAGNNRPNNRPKNDDDRPNKDDNRPNNDDNRSNNDDNDDYKEFNDEEELEKLEKLDERLRKLNDEKELEKLDERFKKLINKKRLESLTYLKEESSDNGSDDPQI